jgi:FkbM family methyltransferase
MRTVFPWQVENELKPELFGPLQSGFFVEVGANQPQQASQTWQFERAGWRGVLIESQPDLAERSRQSRRAVVVAAAYSSPANAGAAMTLHVLGPHSSLNCELAGTRVAADSTIDIAVRTFDEILEQAGAPAPIDFVSIDVEGHEVEALSSFVLARWRPRLVLVEDHVTGLATHGFLTLASYRLIRRAGPNGWYVPQADAPHVGFGRRQIARKYYLALPIRTLRDRKRRLRDRLRQCFGARTAATLRTSDKS